jgi:hypothetical protein
MGKKNKSTNDLIYPLFEVHALLSLSIIASKQTNEICLNTMTPKKKKSGSFGTQLNVTQSYYKGILLRDTEIFSNNLLIISSQVEKRK